MSNAALLPVSLDLPSNVPAGSQKVNTNECDDIVSIGAAHKLRGELLLVHVKERAPGSCGQMTPPTRTQIVHERRTASPT